MSVYAVVDNWVWLRNLRLGMVVGSWVGLQKGWAWYMACKILKFKRHLRRGLVDLKRRIMGLDAFPGLRVLREWTLHYQEPPALQTGGQAKGVFERRDDAITRLNHLGEWQQMIAHPLHSTRLSSGSVESEVQIYSIERTSRSQILGGWTPTGACCPWGTGNMPGVGT